MAQGFISDKAQTTASWAFNAVVATSASWASSSLTASIAFAATSASFASNSLSTTSASFASRSISSSFAETSSYPLQNFTIVTLVTGSSNDITMSFSGGLYQQVNLTTGKAYQFTASNVPATGGAKIILIISHSATTATSSLSFPTSWKSLSGGWPTQITASKMALVELFVIPTNTIMGAFSGET